MQLPAALNKKRNVHILSIGIFGIGIIAAFFGEIGGLIFLISIWLGALMPQIAYYSNTSRSSIMRGIWIFLLAATSVYGCIAFISVLMETRGVVWEQWNLLFFVWLFSIGLLQLPIAVEQKNLGLFVLSFLWMISPWGFMYIPYPASAIPYLGAILIPYCIIVASRSSSSDR